MTTSSTTATLTAVIAAETFEDILVPITSMEATKPTISSAPQSRSIGPSRTVPPPNPNTVPR